MRQLYLVVAVSGLMWLGNVGSVRAEENSSDRVEQLEKKVDELTKKLEEMQKKLEASPKTEAPTAAATAAKPEETPAKEKKWYDAIDVSGFIDGYYSFNFNRPHQPAPPGATGVPGVPVDNTLRNFDFSDNQFSLNLAELVLNKASTKDQPGFTMKMAFGPTTDWVHAGDTTPEIWKHILQAYVTIPMTKSKYGDKLDIGKFVTHHGAEVIETKDNWNYTRSLLFSWAIPYYHMGARYWRYMNKDQTKYLCLHVYNGWNNVKDNNPQKSAGIMYGAPLSPKASLVFNYTGGDEPVVPLTPIPAGLVASNLPSGPRHLFDTVFTYNANSRLTYVLNADWARQENVLPPAPSVAQWYGIAGYARYALSDTRALVGRLEYFKDRDGFTTGTAQGLKEITLTYEMKGPASLLTRFELRRDWSDAAAFLDNAGGFTQKDQTTFLIGSVYPF